MRNLEHLQPAPPLSAERLEHAALVLARLAENSGLDGWTATFRRDNAELTGVDRYPDVELLDFEVTIEHLLLDDVDPEGSWQRHLERCRLAIKQGIERADLELRLMREALADSDENQAKVGAA